MSIPHITDGQVTLWEKMTVRLGPYMVPGAICRGFLKPRSFYGLFCFDGWFRKIGRVCQWGLWGKDIVMNSSGGHWDGHSTQQCGRLTFISNLHGLLWNKMAGKGPHPEGEGKRSLQVVNNPINNVFLQVKFLCSIENVLYQGSIICGSVPGSPHSKSGRELSHIGEWEQYHLILCTGSFPSPYKFFHPWKKEK